MKAILYARYSPGVNKDKQSGNDQFMVLREYCEQNGLDIEGEFIDKNISGKDEDRPALWEAIESLKRGYVLLSRDMERLARNTMFCISLEIIVGKKGAKIVTLRGTDSSDKSPEAVFMRQIMMSSAEFERANSARRTSAAMRLRLKRGLVVGGNQPYGYMRDANKPGALIKDVYEQQVLGIIMRESRIPFSSQHIAKLLNINKYTKRNGSPWDRTTISRIIKRESA